MKKYLFALLIAMPLAAHAMERSNDIQEPDAPKYMIDIELPYTRMRPVQKSQDEQSRVFMELYIRDLVQSSKNYNFLKKIQVHIISKEPLRFKIRFDISSEKLSEPYLLDAVEGFLRKEISDKALVIPTHS